MANEQFKGGRHEKALMILNPTLDEVEKGTQVTIGLQKDGVLGKVVLAFVKDNWGRPVIALVESQFPPIEVVEGDYISPHTLREESFPLKLPKGKYYRVRELWMALRWYCGRELEEEAQTKVEAKTATAVDTSAMEAPSTPVVAQAAATADAEELVMPPAPKAPAKKPPKPKKEWATVVGGLEGLAALKVKETHQAPPTVQ